MRVLSCVQSQTRLHGPHCSEKKPEFQHGSAPPADTCSSSGPRRRRDVDELHDGWHPAMLSIGTFGIRHGHRDELERMQQELMRAKAVTTTAEEDEEDRRRHLTPRNGGIARHRSLRKLVSSVFSGTAPRSPRLSFRGATPELRPAEIPWPLLHNDIPAENLVMSEAMIKSYRTAQLPWRGNAMGAEQGSKWIRTDSEYIVLEI